MIVVYRYNQGSINPTIQTIMPGINGGGDSKRELPMIEWAQCCHMAWIYGVTTCSIRELAQAMVDHDCGYVATYLCSTYAGSHGHQPMLSTLGFKKIADVPGPSEKYRKHGQDMEIWMYSMVEHDTYRKMKEAMKPFLETQGEERIFS